jgi:hypothetical protein
MPFAIPYPNVSYAGATLEMESPRQRCRGLQSSRRSGEQFKNGIPEPISTLKEDIISARTTPNGKVKKLLRTAIDMPPHPNGAATLRARRSMKLHTLDVFWMDVILGKVRLTRMPLNLLI